jgi:hypothetical protein
VGDVQQPLKARDISEIPEAGVMLETIDEGRQCIAVAIEVTAA